MGRVILGALSSGQAMSVSALSSRRYCSPQICLPAVTVVDHRPAYGDPARFAGATVSIGPAGELAARVDLARHFAAVVMSHHLASDRAYLVALAASGIGHVGLLGAVSEMTELGTIVPSFSILRICCVNVCLHGVSWGA